MGGSDKLRLKGVDSGVSWSDHAPEGLDMTTEGEREIDPIQLRSFRRARSVRRACCRVLYFQYEFGQERQTQQAVNPEVHSLVRVSLKGDRSTHVLHRSRQRDAC